MPAWHAQTILSIYVWAAPDTLKRYFEMKQSKKARIRFQPKHDSMFNPKTKLVAQSPRAPTKPRHQRRRVRGGGGGRAHPRSPRRHIQLLEQAEQTIRPCCSSISQGHMASSGQSHFCQVHCEISDPGMPKCNLTKENLKGTLFCACTLLRLPTFAQLCFQCAATWRNENPSLFWTGWSPKNLAGTIAKVWAVWAQDFWKPPLTELKSGQNPLIDTLQVCQHKLLIWDWYGSGRNIYIYIEK